MAISEFSLTHLAKALCGDGGYTPYLNGPSLVTFFNKYGYNEVYGPGFPSRWKYTEDKLRELNGRPAIVKIIEEILDPRRYHGMEITAEAAAREMNEFLKYDKIQVRPAGDFYKVVASVGMVVESAATKALSHDFISEQVKKCERKITEEDFNGAVTNARSLVEALFIEIIERSHEKEIKNDGNIENLWSQVKKIMKLNIAKEELPDFVVQILSGIDTSLKGLAALSNNAGDRHANKFRTRKHHAKLAVNLSMTIADFLLESYDYQQELASAKKA